MSAYGPENKDVNFRNEHGETPLHIALGSEGLLFYERYLSDRYPSELKEFIELGQKANLNVRDHNGFTPLHLCIKAYSPQIYLRSCMKSWDVYKLPLLETLLNAGADPKVRDSSGKSAFHLVVSLEYNGQGKWDWTYGTFPFLGYLKGANVNTKDNNGDTPLHTAVEHDRIEMAKWLLNNGADASLANDRGETPANIALRYRFFEMFNLLKDHVAKNTQPPVTYQFDSQSVNNSLQNVSDPVDAKFVSSRRTF